MRNENIALSVADSAALIGISKSNMYELIKSLDCDFAFKLGGRWLISRARLEAWVDRKAEESRS